MVKRVKQQDLAGALDFEGKTAQDPEFATWLRPAPGPQRREDPCHARGKGVRVLFSEAADMALWTQTARS